MATTDIYHVSGSLKGRKAIRCLGGDVDDYIQVNAAAVARTTANDTVGTFSAWVNVADIAGTYCILCAGDADAVEFIELNIEAGLLTARCTDATVAQFVTQADAIEIKAHLWYHVAMVQGANGDGVKLYVNGKLIVTTHDTSTDVDEWFNNCDGIDLMRIGAAAKDGAAGVTNEFKGAISDVKYWNRALLPEQVDLDYRGSPQPLVDKSSPPVDISDATYLQNHWDFDDDLIDAGLGADDGTNTGAGIVLNNNYSEYTSRLGFMTGVPVVADAIQCFADEGVGHALIIQAA